MTDPFADLERELLAAHARRARPRPSTPSARVLAMAAAAAAVVAAVALVGAQSDPERVVAPTPQPAAPAGSCDGGWQPPVTQDPVPPELAERLAFLRSDSRSGVDYRLPGGQATRLYGLPVTMPHHGGYDVLAVAADIVPRAEVIRSRDPCLAPSGRTRPGVCLMLVNDEGGINACFTMAEIEAGEAFIDVRDSIVGLAPDGAERAVVGDARSEVEGNVFALPAGPEAKVDFEP